MGLSSQGEPHRVQWLKSSMDLGRGSCRFGCSVATRPLQTAVDVCGQRAGFVQKCAERSIRARRARCCFKVRALSADPLLPLVLETASTQYERYFTGGRGGQRVR